MRKVRQHLATALIVAMVGSTMVTPTLADTINNESGEGKKGWFQVDEDWYFRKEDGTLRTDQYWYQEAEKTWYGFDQDGRMFSDELIYDERLSYISGGDTADGEPTPVYYAYKSGKLAPTGWLLLADDWYYFEKENTDDGHIFKTSGTPAYDLGRIAAGKEVTVPQDGRKATFGLSEVGVMFSRQWVLWRSDGTIESVLSEDQDPDYVSPEEGSWHFYKNNGERVEDGSIPLGNDWYRFDQEGNWTGEKVTASLATPSQLKDSEWLVDSVIYTGKTNDIEAIPGEEVSLEFKVNLATDSNAASTQVFKRKRHDIWMPEAKYGDWKFDVNESKSTCTVKYTKNPAYFEDEYLHLVIDGKESDTGVTVKTVIRTNSKDSQQTVENILGAVKDKDDVNVTAGMLRDSLATTYAGGDEETPKDIVKEAMKQTLVENVKDLEQLSADYAADNSIDEMEPDVDDDAAAVLPDGATVEVVGGALNAEENDSVQLKVSKGSSEAEEKVPAKENQVRIALDLVLKINEEPSKELDIPVVITISIPKGLKASSVKLYHVHGDNDAEEVASAKIRGNKITFAADRFSDYVFVGDPADAEDNPSRPGGGSSSGSGGGSGGGSGSTSSSGSYAPDTISGSWQQDERGWRFQLSDGSYAENQWGRLNGVWYYFGADTYMMTGWFFDQAYNRWFYLNPEQGAQAGKMLTGWQKINDVWYYLNPVADGTAGAMLADQWIGDYYVNADGAWVEGMTR